MKHNKLWQTFRHTHKEWSLTGKASDNIAHYNYVGGC